MAIGRPEGKAVVFTFARKRAFVAGGAGAALLFPLTRWRAECYFPPLSRGSFTARRVPEAPAGMRALWENREVR